MLCIRQVSAVCHIYMVVYRVSYLLKCYWGKKITVTNMDVKYD